MNNLDSVVRERFLQELIRPLFVLTSSTSRTASISPFFLLPIRLNDVVGDVRVAKRKTERFPGARALRGLRAAS